MGLVPGLMNSPIAATNVFMLPGARPAPSKEAVGDLPSEVFEKPTNVFQSIVGATTSLTVFIVSLSKPGGVATPPGPRLQTNTLPRRAFGDVGDGDLETAGRGQRWEKENVAVAGQLTQEPVMGVEVMTVVCIWVGGGRLHSV